ncbi:hypothetical protein M2651_08330 [Clostridium sp. SYSU_GA19001]|uniref:hypothetical protein n=1 Tax=Clostridium caldaquaticum TaxID=2940653 RepID=UPI002077269F|nr:hypothetical protein [Clostridium caldaquaticum]MCM8711032.1 hypothetical protein [Clostridium caldaquaticum]
MENLNFIPKELEKKFIDIKIKKYKTCILVLWLLCLILYGTMLFGKSKNEQLIQKKKAIISYKLSETEISNAHLKKTSYTIQSFKKFLADLNKDLNYKSVEINDNKITADLIIYNKDQYYSIIKNIENYGGYSILSLSPLYEKDNVFSFNFILEVKL